MAKNYWLVKQEPESYSWDTFVKEGGTDWTGVRNFQARNHLRSMKRGDLVLFYHSVSEKAVVGIAKVTHEAFPDPTASEGEWCAVTLAPTKPFRKPVTLAQIKSNKLLRNLQLVRQGRLSVMPVGKKEFNALLKLGETDV